MNTYIAILLIVCAWNISVCFKLRSRNKELDKRVKNIEDFLKPLTEQPEGVNEVTDGANRLNK